MDSLHLFSLYYLLLFLLVILPSLLLLKYGGACVMIPRLFPFYRFSTLAEIVK
jgi:membrane protein implicated in regulation of membrane protease activity